MRNLGPLLGFVLLAAVVALFGASWLLPSRVEVERHELIAAPRERIHDWVGDLRRWPEFAPWSERADPTAVFRFGGQSGEAGAVLTWRGERLGEGRLTVTANDPAKGVWYDLSLAGGRRAWKGAVRYLPAGSPGATDVVWSQAGELGGVLARWHGLAVDRALGPALEESLERLAGLVEGTPAGPDRPEPPGD
jgi:hypothetical protein